MKRFLVLLLVLSLVSTASATLKELRVAVGGTTTDPLPIPGQQDYTDPVDSLINLHPSDLLWIGVYNTQQGVPGDTGQDSMYLGIDLSGGGEWTGAWHIYGTVGDPGYQNFYNEYQGVIEGFGDMWLLQMTHPASDYVGVGVVDAKLFHCIAPNIDVVATLYTGDGTYVDSFVIHQIPEPVTMALLGLGTLFLRRRK